MNAPEGQHKKAKGQRPWWTRPTHQRPEGAKALWLVGKDVFFVVRDVV